MKDLPLPNPEDVDDPTVDQIGSQSQAHSSHNEDEISDILIEMKGEEPNCIYNICQP